jgi:hypothetical protein
MNLGNGSAIRRRSDAGVSRCDIAGDLAARDTSVPVALERSDCRNAAPHGVARRRYGVSRFDPLP